MNAYRQKFSYFFLHFCTFAVHVGLKLCVESRAFTTTKSVTCNTTRCDTSAKSAQSKTTRLLWIDMTRANSTSPFRLFQVVSEWLRLDGSGHFRFDYDRPRRIAIERVELRVTSECGVVTWLAKSHRSQRSSPRWTLERSLLCNVSTLWFELISMRF